MTDTLDIRMLVTVKERDSFGERSLDVFAEPVYIVNEDGKENVRYFSDGFSEPGHPEWYALRFPCYCTLREDGHELWGWNKIEYSQPFSIELSNAETMVKELRRLHKGYERLTRRFGPPESYSGFLAYMADLLGVSQFGFRHSDSVWAATGTQYRWCGADHLAGYLEHQLGLVAKAGARS